MLRASVFLLPALVFFPLHANAQMGPGCGAANVKFDVQTKKGVNAVRSLEPGKALVWFIQDDIKFTSGPRPTTRFGIDGKWVGATHANSYFYVFVDPGEHRVCANWQSLHTFLGYVGPKRSTAAAHFSAEAGKTYYFRAQDRGTNNDAIVSEPEVVLAPLDPDEAQVIMQSFSFSISHPRK